LFIPGVADGAGALLLHRVEGEAGVTPAAGTLARLNGQPLAQPCCRPAAVRRSAELRHRLAVVAGRRARPKRADGDPMMDRCSRFTAPLATQTVAALTATMPPAPNSMRRPVTRRIVLAELADGPSLQPPRTGATAASRLGGANRRLLLTAALLLGLVGLLVLLLARLETVKVSVQPASAEVSGSGFGWRSGDTLLLLPREAGHPRRGRGLSAGRACRHGTRRCALDRRPAAQGNARRTRDRHWWCTPRAFVDGAEAGRAPGEVPVAGGERTLTLRAGAIPRPRRETAYRRTWRPPTPQRASAAFMGRRSR
jgi:hypothetical protein